MKISILVNSFIMSRWVINMIKILKDDSDLSISIIKVTLESSGYEKTNLIIKKYIDLDSKLFKSNTNALKKEDIKKIYKNINYIETDHVSFKENNLMNNFFQADDILINLSKCKLSYKVFSLVRFGVWEFFVEEKNVTNYSVGVIEVLKQKSPINLYLSSNVGDDEKKIILYQSSSYCDKRSLNRTMNGILFKLSLFAPRVVKLIKNNNDYLLNKKKHKDKK